MSKRVDRIKESGIRNIFDKAATMKDVVNLSIGQPDFAVPDAVKESIKKAIDEDKTKYTPSPGIDELRSKIVKKYNLDSNASSAIVTSGTSGALVLSYSVLMDPGDEMIIFDPYFVIYREMTDFLGIKPVVVGLNEDFSLNVDNLKKSITGKTKAIMVNSPSNPTGYVLSSDEVDAIVAVAKENDLWIISDEVYEMFDYDNKFCSFAGKYEKTLVLGGFSKNFAMTGLRVGYAVGPGDVINDMIKLQQYSYVCAPSAMQYGVMENFDIDMSSEVEVFAKRRDYVYEKLKDVYDVVKPSGAFYFFIKCPEGMTGSKFADKCVSKGLLVVPAAPFSEDDDYFRISYAVDDEMLKKGVDILVDIAESE